MDWTTFVTSLLGVGFVGALLKIWLDHRFRNQETKLSEERQLQQKRR